MKCNYIFSLSVYTFVSLFIMLLNTTVYYNINNSYTKEEEQEISEYEVYEDKYIDYIINKKDYDKSVGANVDLNELLVYDNTVKSGADVKDLINRYKNEQLAILVKTKSLHLSLKGDSKSISEVYKVGVGKYFNYGTLLLGCMEEEWYSNESHVIITTGYGSFKEKSKLSEDGSYLVSEFDLIYGLNNNTITYNINDEENSEYIAKDYMFYTNLIRNNRDDIIGIMCTQKT